MRVSMDESDRGYTGRLPGVRVYLDGQEQRGVITADDEEGLVVRLQRNRLGHFVLDEARQEAAREEIRGVVRIEMPAAREGAAP